MLSRLILSQWRMKDFDVGAGLAGRAFDDDGDAADWVEVCAPGDTYLALHAAGRLPHPFADQNEAECAWVSRREWWWRGDFTPPPVKASERLTLRFLGLDTFATIWLNGEVLGETDNMFRAYAYDVTDKVRADRPNKLGVRFDSPADRLKDRAPAPFVGAGTLDNKRNLVRKAQFGWGWDWGPGLPTVGLWRPVELTVHGAASLDSIHFSTLSLTPDHDRARVRVAVAADIVRAGAYVADITLSDPDGAVVARARAPLEGPNAASTFTLEAPRLWWTHDLGASSLYTLDVRLM